jgi:hypothetical protein
VVKVISELFELGRIMMSSRGAENFSEYVRGLILLDAAHYSPELLAGPGLPGWITTDERFEKYFLPGDDNAGEMTKGKV